MNEAEVKAAAERGRLWPVTAVEPGDINLLADYALTTLETVEDGPWTFDWLKSIGFVGELKDAASLVQNGGRALIVAAPNSTWIYQMPAAWDIGDGQRVAYVPEPKTKRDVLELCRLLGFALGIKPADKGDK